MPLPARTRVLQAMSPNVWDTSNQILYDLCQTHPKHTSVDVIIAKVLLIGRVYAAAIERRRNKEEANKNENFYVDSVAPSILHSDIDSWLQESRNVIGGNDARLEVLTSVHARVTSLFNFITNLDKRSLASKYLHFHVPQLFYIYDSRAVKGIREFSDVLPRASRAIGNGDNEYRKFTQKAQALVSLCAQQYDLVMSPRQLDNLLLGVSQ
jgi:hypothetical protein